MEPKKKTKTVPVEARNDARFLRDHGYEVPDKPGPKHSDGPIWIEMIKQAADIACEEVILKEERAQAEWERLIREHEIGKHPDRDNRSSD